MGPLLSGKIAKIVIYDKGCVIFETNYDSSGLRWIHKLVCNKLKCRILQVTIWLHLGYGLAPRLEYAHITYCNKYSVAMQHSCSILKF